MSMLLRRMLATALAPVDQDGAGGGGAAADGRPEDITEDEWARLTEAERAAIADDDGEELDPEALRKIAGDDSSADAKAAADAAAAAAAEAEAAAAAAAGDTPEFAPAYRAEVSADLLAQNEADKKALADLKEKFRAGDIELDEYEAQREGISDRMREFDKAQVKAEVSREMGEQTAAQRWGWEVDNFFAEEGNALYKGKAAGAAFDAIVKDLVSDKAMEQHPERANWSGRRILIEADKVCRAELGLAAAAPAKEPGAQPKPLTEAERIRQANAARRPKPTEVPKTLANVPAADQDASGRGAEGGEFAFMDNLHGIAYENAMARMTDVQRDRFLQA